MRHIARGRALMGEEPEKGLEALVTSTYRKIQALSDEEWAALKRRIPLAVNVAEEEKEEEGTD